MKSCLIWDFWVIKMKMDCFDVKMLRTSSQITIGMAVSDFEMFFPQCPLIIGICIYFSGDLKNDEESSNCNAFPPDDAFILICSVVRICR